MPNRLDQIMEQASRALSETDYLTCEARCLEALSIARREGDWSYYSRVLLPLQESRRQRRILAAEGTLRLGTSRLSGPLSPPAVLEQLNTGCIVVTHPHTAEDATRLARTAFDQRRFVEVLYADSPSDAAIWTVRSFAGPDVVCPRPAPPCSWREHWLPVEADNRTLQGQGKSEPDDVLNLTVKAADWFLDAYEALGNVALAQVDPSLSGARRAEVLERSLETVADHEILLQCLAEAARNAVMQA